MDSPSVSSPPASMSGKPATIPATSSSPQAGPTACWSEPSTDFFRWLATCLEIRCSEDGRKLSFLLSQEERDRFDGRECLELDMEAVSGGRQALQDTEAVQWLLDRYREAGSLVHARPIGSPMAVHEITDRLFAAYQVDNGNVHLQGCQLEPRPFLRLSFLDDADTAIQHVLVGPDGSSVPTKDFQRLRLQFIDVLTDPPQRPSASLLDAKLAAGKRMAAQIKEQRNPEASVDDPIAVAIVWVRYASGRLQFTIGKQSVTLPFAGWANLLTPPPYECPITDRKTFHLVATDDHRIVAAEEIGSCSKTGRRTLLGELSVCRLTGQLALPEYLKQCPVLGESILSEHFDNCQSCQERVSEKALHEQVCDACRNLNKVSDGDTRLSSLQSVYPGLKKAKSLRMTETENVILLQTANWLSKRLLVFDRHSLDLKHAAKGSRWSARRLPLDRSGCLSELHQG